MFYSFGILLYICKITIVIAELLASNNLNAILLKCSDFANNHRPCVPHLIININFASNLNSNNVDKLLILDETYEPSKHQTLKIMSPYIIVITRSEHIISYPLKSSYFISPNNSDIIEPGLNSPIVNIGRLRTKIDQNSKINNKNISHTGNSTSDFGGQSKIHLTPTDETPDYSMYNLSAPDPYLAAKVRIFRKRKSTWWRIMPIISLNNLSGTYVSGNLSALLTSHEDILDKKLPTFLKDFKLFIPSSLSINSDELNGLRIYKNIFMEILNNNTNKLLNFAHKQMNEKKESLANNSTDLQKGLNKLSQNKDPGLGSPSIKILSKCPNNKNAICLNVLDDQVPAFDIKIKMPFVENAAQLNVFKVKIARIVTDATTKDALQISVDVINKGLRSHEFEISVCDCPLSETEAVTSVSKILLPYISETITFLLPFVMGTKKNVKFTCDVVVKADKLKSSHLDPKRSGPPNSNVVIVSKRPMKIETHLRCFCVWNCRCHCIGRIETHSDVNVCQKMSYEAQKDAGLLLNCPLDEDLCSLDLSNNINQSESSSFDPYKTIATILIILMILFLLVYFCKCFKPRKKDLIVASTEWICCAENNSIKCKSRHKTITREPSRSSPPHNYFIKSDAAPSAKVSFCPSPEIIRKKPHQSDLLESALITLARQQKELKKQSMKKE